MRRRERSGNTSIVHYRLLHGYLNLTTCSYRPLAIVSAIRASFLPAGHDASPQNNVTVTGPHLAFRDDVRDGVRVRDDVSDAVIDLDIVGVRDGVRDGVMDRDVDRVSVGERDAVRDDVSVGPPVCDGGGGPRR